MRVYIDSSKIITRTEPKTIRFDLFEKVDNSLKQEISYIIIPSEFIAEHRMKNEISFVEK